MSVSRPGSPYDYLFLSASEKIEEATKAKSIGQLMRICCLVQDSRPFISLGGRLLLEDSDALFSGAGEDIVSFHVTARKVLDCCNQMVTESYYRLSLEDRWNISKPHHDLKGAYERLQKEYEALDNDSPKARWRKAIAFSSLQNQRMRLEDLMQKCFHFFPEDPLLSKVPEREFCPLSSGKIFVSSNTLETMIGKHRWETQYVPVLAKQEVAEKMGIYLEFDLLAPSHLSVTFDFNVDGAFDDLIELRNCIRAWSCKRGDIGFRMNEDETMNIGVKEGNKETIIENVVEAHAIHTCEDRIYQDDQILQPYTLNVYGKNQEGITFALTASVSCLSIDDGKTWETTLKPPLIFTKGLPIQR